MRGLKQTYSLLDLTSLSISSVGPAFSIAAAAGVMIGYSGVYSLLAILLIAIPFVSSAFVFRMLNQHFPQAGASYHWAARVTGVYAARFQGWVIILAYFASLPPIVLPAAEYTLALLHPAWQNSTWAEFAVSVFWLVFAALPLISGARPTARITQLFLVVEIVFLVAFVTIGIIALPHAHVALVPGKFPVAGVLLTMVVATTILDGWEIDSYASEEAAKPTQDPGVGGIIGAIVALVMYGVLFPLILGETPLRELANSPDPLVAWVQHLAPVIPVAWGKWILIPILASTAGSLWLTGFILIRALFSMGRDGLIPDVFAKVNRRGAPGAATLIVFAALLAMTALQLFVSSLSTLFAILLSSAGFFLTLEFALDSVTASVFVWRLHRSHHAGRALSHRHGWIGLVSAMTTVYLGCILVAFLLLSPRVISPWTDVAIGGLLLGGVAFTLYRRKRGQPTHVLPVADAPAGAEWTG